MTLHAMDDLAFSDWPGQPVDLSGSNPWLPAYGFQPPSALLDKDDFLGNPDADLFLNGSVGQHYVYLETIQEETSDDLRSESDRSESRASPVGWLATDSETGSVIRIDHIDDVDCESDREMACVAKRRRLDNNFLGVSDDESSYSLSRSSSLLQFESLEKQCQDLSSSSPSLFSNFSYDSLEHQRKMNVSPDSLDREAEPESEYYKTLKVDVPTRRQLKDGIRQNSVESSDSQETLSRDNSSKSINNLKTWRSFDSLHSSANKNKSDNKVSAENLSEDSGYSDHLYNYVKNKSNSNPNVTSPLGKTSSGVGKQSASKRLGFDAYDGDVVQNFNSNNFGISYQDLTVFERYEYRSPLIDRFMRNGAAKRLSNRNFAGSNRADTLNIDQSDSERTSKYNQTFCSEPNLLGSKTGGDEAPSSISNELLNIENVCVSSVPKDLNYALDKCQSWKNCTDTTSIAAKNFDIADLPVEDLAQDMIMSKKVRRARNDSAADKIFIKLRKDDSSSLSSEEPASFKREGSYLEAMANRVDISDDEHNPCYRDNIAKSTIAEFDKQILKAISETSIQSFGNSREKLDLLFSSPIIISSKRNVISTPNLTIFAKGNDFNDISLSSNDSKKRYSAMETPRKSSLVNRSTSTSGMSDADDKTLTPTKSFSGSTGSKGVHFCPVVAEVKWRDRDDSVSTERESSYSISSNSESEDCRNGFKKRIPNEITNKLDNKNRTVDVAKKSDDYFEEVESLKKFDYGRPVNESVIRPTPRKISASQPVLMDIGSTESVHMEDKSVEYSFTPLKPKCTAVSEPEIVTESYYYNQMMDNKKSKSEMLGVTAGDDRQPTTAPSTPSHMGSNKLQVNSGVAKSVGSMEPAVASREGKQARTGKLGGFFSRLASFRFSSRKNEDKKKKKSSQLQEKSAPVNQQRIATKEDYIYIPLKGPIPDESPQHHKKNQKDVSSSVVSKKPPLPKMPPRVVGASVKKTRQESTNAQPKTPERRTIDSGDLSPRPMEPMGLIETDLDTEVTVITSGAHVKTRSLMNLGAEAPALSLAAPTHPARPHKSMEFLLDKQNLKVVEPPENELQKGERVMSEHELRVQRSLQKLTVPDWYKQGQVPREGFLLKKNTNRESRWTGTNSKTTSLSSLGSSNQSPLVLSPTPQSQPFVRWSLSKLNSTASSPCASTRSSFNTRQPNGSISPSSLRSSFSYRQPYLGWRSQERLSRPRTPAERLANTILTHSQTQQPQESPEIQTSIKEVTSAIVHYVSGLKPEEGSKDYPSYESQETVSQRSRSVSPRGSQKLCWLESSFVGTRPLDTPQTPLTLSESQTSTPIPPNTLRLDLQTHNDVSLLNADGNAKRPSPSSTTLEDVLDSLLGLPSSTRAPSPSLQVTVSANTSPSRLNEDLQIAEQFRRRSEGSEPTCRSSSGSRRISFHASPVLRCRYSRCGKVAVASSTDGLAFKNCHNCSYTYCSRACRRAHWEKHRKTCLFSRVGTLCRQVIAAVKEQVDTLLHVSVIARRGYLSQGLGAVKCFFPCPEDAEKFLLGGLSCLGEPTYVRWADLLPSEMGPQLYAELVKMCKNYNPDSKLVLYVSVCVVSEAPAAGAVKWERQLVSRCAKMRLSKNVPIPEKETENPETLILTSTASKDCSVQRAREISFNNIQKYLIERGVSLKQQYPDIYQQLCVYVEGNCDKFAPVTVYPRDTETGKPFMCIIMPEADPESVRQVSTAGVRVRTVDVLQD